MIAIAKFGLVVCSLCFALGSGAAPRGGLAVGAAAPTFQSADSNGKSVSLNSLRGKFVVLEWSNFTCPYVQKHYNSGNMQGLQRKYTGKGVVWLTVFSNAEGMPGYYPNPQLNKLAAQKRVASTLIPDPSGKLGRLYNARNTPTMFVINPEGNIIYMGGIDDKATPDVEDIPKAKNYVSAALDEAMAGKPVSVPTSRPYGCGIHY